MSQMGIDIAWARPTVADIQKTGAHWVARYFSQDPTKDLTAGEVKAYTAAGLAIVTVYETTTGRALQGRPAGIYDAQQAQQERAAVGLPNTAPIHWAVDTDTDYASVKAYADGWASVIPKSLSGPYGGFKVVDAARHDGWAYGWQTTAWSGGQWSPLATIKQVGGTVLSGGADVDYAEVPDFGQYPRPEEVVTPQDIQAIVDGVWSHQVKDVENGSMVQIGTIMAYMDYMHKRQENAIGQVAAQEAAIQAAILKLTTGGVDPATLAQDVIKDLGAALAKA